MAAPDLDSAAFSIAARLRSFRYAGRGLCRLLRDEHNAWLHLGATAVVALTASWLRITAADWRWLILAAALVWMAEAVNTAVEELCDRLHPGLDPVIGRIKDLAAGAVLVAAAERGGRGGRTRGPPLRARRGWGWWTSCAASARKGGGGGRAAARLTPGPVRFKEPPSH